MKINLLVFICLLMCLTSVAQDQPLHWTAFEHLDDSLRRERKPVLVFIHTEWCKYCKMQDNTTFQNEEVVETLNRSFYVLRLDAEYRNNIHFINRNCGFSVSQGYHELAVLLGKTDELIFPTTVLLDENLQLKQRLQGFQDVEALLYETTKFR